MAIQTQTILAPETHTTQIYCEVVDQGCFVFFMLIVWFGKMQKKIQAQDLNCGYQRNWSPIQPTFQVSSSTCQRQCWATMRVRRLYVCSGEPDLIFQRGCRIS